MIVIDNEYEYEFPGEFIVSLSGKRGNSNIDITTYIEQNAKRLRKRYIDFIASLGEKKVKGKRIIDHLELANNVSFWWLTLLAEQNPWKTPSIIEVLKIFALEEIVARVEPGSLVYVGPSGGVLRSLSQLCQANGIDFGWTKTSQNVSLITRILRISRLPHFLHAMFHLFRQIYSNINLKPENSQLNGHDNPQVLICTYLDDIDMDEAVSSGFHSPYWGRLSELLKKESVKANWLHIHIPSKALPDTRSAWKFLNALNSKHQQFESHRLVTGYLDFTIILKILRDYIRLFIKSLTLGELSSSFSPHGSGYSLFPVFTQDWHSSITGAAALNGLLFIALFDRAISRMPKQDKCFYLMENQAWERALLFAWKKQQGGKIIGVQHSMVRFWDLRYFNSDHTLYPAGKNPLPRPDFVAVNGRLAKQSLLDGGYSIKELLDTEALRYEFLDKQEPEHTVLPGESNCLKVLVLGDYVEDTMDKLMTTIIDLPDDLIKRLDIVVKPHPNFQFTEQHYSDIQYSIVNQPLGKIVNNYDIAIASNLTSASVDAVLAGVPVIIISEKDQLNFSPLRMQPGVTFVYSARELDMTISNHRNSGQSGMPLPGDFFFLDKEYPRWLSVLNS